MAVLDLRRLTDRKGRIPSILFSVALVLYTLIVYRPAWNGRVLWDDDAHLTSADLASVSGLGRIWIEPGATQQYYPLVHTVFWIENKLWGDTPLPYHIVSILLHGGAAVLLFRILRRLKVPGATLAAGMFALHPVEVESVAWISELKNTLSGVLALAAVLCYLRFDESRRPKTYLAALATFILALGCKTAIAPVPIVLLVLLWWRHRRISWRRDLVPLTPFLVSGISFGLFTVWIERTFVGASGPEFQLGFVERGLIAGRAFWFYLAKLLWPSDLMFVYPRWQIDALVWWQYIFPAGALLLFGILFVWRKQLRGTFVGMLVFTALLFPALGFINIYPFRFSFVADHFQYFASMAGIALVAAGLTIAFARLNAPRVLRIAASLALLVTLGLLSSQQCRAYTDPEKFYRTILGKNPRCWMAWHNLGQVSAGEGRIDEAIADYNKALELRPRFAEPQINLGAIYGQLGQTDVAISHLRTALEIDPTDGAAEMDLGNTLLESGRVEEAIEHSRKAVDLQFHRGQIMRAKAEFNLANALFRGNRLEEAVSHYRSAAKLYPQDAGTHNNLSKALFALNEVEEAKVEYAKAVQLSHAAASAHPRKRAPFLRPR